MSSDSQPSGTAVRRESVASHEAEYRLIHRRSVAELIAGERLANPRLVPDGSRRRLNR